MFKITWASLIAIGQTVCAPVLKGQHRVLRLVQFVNIFKFPKPPRACLQLLLKVTSQSMNSVCSCKETPGTPASTISKFLNFQNHHGHVYNNLWKFHRNRMNGVCSYTGHRHDFYIYIKFPKPLRACLQQLVKVKSQSMNGVCSYKATLGTPASTIFKFPKPHEHV